MALERVPADIRKNGGVARMSDPTMINEIKAAVTIPVMAKARIGHYVEAQILQALDVDYIDESEVGTQCWISQSHPIKHPSRSTLSISAVHQRQCVLSSIRHRGYLHSKYKLQSPAARMMQRKLAAD